MKRKIYERLLEWKKRSNGKTALLIDGCWMWIIVLFALMGGGFGGWNNRGDVASTRRPGSYYPVRDWTMPSIQDSVLHSWESSRL